MCKGTYCDFSEENEVDTQLCPRRLGGVSREVRNPASPCECNLY